MKLKPLIIAFVAFMLFTKEAAAQNKKRYEAQRIEDRKESLQRQPNTVIDIPKVTFLFPGFSYEKAIGKFQTIQAYGLYNLYTYSENVGNGTTNTTYYFDPTIMLSYRYYCNHDRRQELGKQTERNTMNYISPFGQVFFSKSPIGKNSYENSGRRPLYMFGLLYGLQRNYNSHFSLDINFGLGVITGNSRYYDPITSSIKEGNQSQVTIPGQITLGFWLGKK